MRATRYAKGLSKGIFWLISLALLLALVLPSCGTGVVQASPDTEILKPSAYTFYTPGSNTDPGDAYDGTTGGENTTYNRLSVGTKTRDPAMEYHTWQSPSHTHTARRLYIRRSGTGNQNDTWGIYYSTNGGTSYTAIETELINPAKSNTAAVTIDTGLDLSNLRVKISTVRLGGDDGGFADIWDVWLVGDYAPLSTAIEIRAQDYLTAVSAITFPEGAPGATASNPSNDQAETQAFGGAGIAKPVVTLYNGGSATYTIWYNIATFTEGIVSSEYYLINAKGAACTSADSITNAVTFDADTITGTTIAAGSGNEKDLYLKIILSDVAGKSGTSTLTILGEA